MSSKTFRYCGTVVKEAHNRASEDCNPKARTTEPRQRDMFGKVGVITGHGHWLVHDVVLHMQDSAIWPRLSCYLESLPGRETCI